jgi:hypothetical protein
LERGALSACWPRTTAWMNAIVSNPLVREWLDEADRLPHIWFDDPAPRRAAADAGKKRHRRAGRGAAGGG